MSARRETILIVALCEIAFSTVGVLCVTGTIPIRHARVGMLVLCLACDVAILYLSGWWIVMADEIDRSQKS